MLPPAACLTVPHWYPRGPREQLQAQPDPDFCKNIIGFPSPLLPILLLSLSHTHTHSHTLTHTHTPLISHLFFPIYWLHDFLFLLGSADTKPKMALNIRLRLFLEKLRMSKAGKHTPSQDPP